jgi:bacterioferritin-associated ferredoxin
MRLPSGVAAGIGWRSWRKQGTWSVIVCSCNVISDLEIDQATDELMVEDPKRVITPAHVYRTIGKRPRCGACLSHTAEIAHKRAACLRGCHRCNCKNSHTTRARAFVSDRHGEPTDHHDNHDAANG